MWPQLTSHRHGVAPSQGPPISPREGRDRGTETTLYAQRAGHRPVLPWTGDQRGHCAGETSLWEVTLQGGGVISPSLSRSRWGARPRPSTSPVKGLRSPTRFCVHTFDSLSVLRSDPGLSSRLLVIFLRFQRCEGICHPSCPSASQVLLPGNCRRLGPNELIKPLRLGGSCVAHPLPCPSLSLVTLVATHYIDFTFHCSAVTCI